MQNILDKTEQILKIRNHSSKTRKSYLLYIKQYIQFSKKTRVKNNQQAIENFLLFALRGVSIDPIFVLWHSIGSLLTLLLYIYFFAILVQVIISWVSPGTYNPVTALIHHITEPLMRPARKILPPFSGFDLSPILVFCPEYPDHVCSCIIWLEKN